MNFFPDSFTQCLAQRVFFDNSAVFTLTLNVGDNIASSQLMSFIYRLVGSVKNNLLFTQIKKQNGKTTALHTTDVKLNTKRNIKDHNLELIKSLISSLSEYTAQIKKPTTVCIVLRFNETNNITEATVIKQADSAI